MYYSFNKEKIALVKTNGIVHNLHQDLCLKDTICSDSKENIIFTKDPPKYTGVFQIATKGVNTTTLVLKISIPSFFAAKIKQPHT